MRKSKHILCLIVCFVSLFAKSCFANFPTFDPMTYIPDIKQFKELAEDLRNTKEQLNQIRQDLRAMGDSIRSVASYSQAILHLAKRGLGAVQNTVDLINKTLGTDIKIGEGLNNIIEEAENIHRDVIERTVSDVGDVLDGKKLDEFVDYVEDEKYELIDKVQEPIKDAHQGVVDAWDGMLDDVKEGVDNATGDLRDNVEGHIDNARDSIDTAKDIAKDVKNKKENIENMNKRVVKGLFDVDVEEEEEEEEISNEKIITSLKYYFKSVLEENKKIAGRLNDVLDMHINKLNKSAESADKSLTLLEKGISQSSNFSSKEKEDFANRIIDIKASHRKIYDWNIVLAENTKEKYNKEFKNKILDGISNYEKVAIAYLNGDATRKDVEKIGLKIKQDAKSMTTSTDMKVMKQIKTEALKLKQDLTKLSEDIKKIEQKTKS